jgi:hypothetical protein
VTDVVLNEEFCFRFIISYTDIANTIVANAYRKLGMEDVVPLFKNARH